MKRLVIIWSILLCSSGYAQLINSIEFEGLRKTKESYLRQMIDCEAGDSLNKQTFENDIQYLKNLNLFFNVEGEVSTKDSVNYDVVFKITEARYLYPIFYISGFRDQLKFQIGFNQINFLGRAQSVGAMYQFYDRHSFAFFMNAPRHANRRTGHELSFARYATLEPLYFEDTTSMFNYTNYTASVGGFIWLNRYIRGGLGGMYLYEQYQAQDSAFFEVNQDFDFHKYQIRSNFEYNKVNQHFELRNGLYNNFFIETIQTVGYPDASFFKVVNTSKWFKRFGNRSNVAMRLEAGIATNNFSPFSPFVLDGFINVRGVGNRVARGTAELIYNAEYRFTFLRKKYFILQAVSFLDYGTLRPPGEEIVEMFNYQNQKIYLGLGLRAHSLWLYNTSFRVDYAVNLTDVGQSGFSFGIGQFF